MTKKEEKEKTKIKTPLETTVNIGYTNENTADFNNDNSYVLTPPTPKIYCGTSMHLAEGEYYYNAELKSTFNNKYKSLEDFTIESMQQKYRNGVSASSLSSNIENYLKDNYYKDPDAFQYGLSVLMGGAQKKYDNGTNNVLNVSGFTRKHLGDTPEEILEKILATGDNEDLEGFVCSTIAEYGMLSCHKCDIEAVMIAGGADRSNHTALIYKRADGKYALNNYGTSYVIEDAHTIKEAAQKVYKKNMGLLNNGYIYFIDSKGSYQEFNLKDEAVWGNELDKRDYNHLSVGEYKIPQKSGIIANLNASNQGALSADITGVLAYSSDTVNKATSFSLGYKKSQKTLMADNSQSIGFKIHHIGEKQIKNGKKFNETKFVFDKTDIQCNNSMSIKGESIYTRNFTDNYGEIEPLLNEWNKNFSSPQEFQNIVEYVNFAMDTNLNPDDYSNYNDVFKDLGKQLQIKWNNLIPKLNPESKDEINASYKTTNLSAFLRNVYGKEKVLVDDKNIKLTNTYQGTSTLGINYVPTNNLVFGGDLRVTAGDKLKLDVRNKKDFISNSVSVEGIADFSLKTGVLTPTVSPGIKLNSSSLYVHNNGKRTQIGGSLNSYAVVTRPSTDYGIYGNVFGTYKPSRTVKSISTNVGAGFEKQNLRIGNIQEQTENNFSLGASIQAQINEKVRVGVTYKGKFDNINNAKSRSTLMLTGIVNLPK